MDKELIIEHFKNCYETSNYNDKEFNNRPYDPFHLFNMNYNPNEIVFINEDIMDYYFVRDECYYCTGPWLIRPMSCHNSSECRFNFRGNKTKSGFRAFIETRQSKDSPNSIYMSRYLLSANYFFGLPIIIRTSKLSKLILHHIDHDPFNDRLGNHTFVFDTVHTGIHTTIRHLENKLNKIDLFDPENKEIIKQYQHEIRRNKIKLLNSKPALDMIHYVINNYSEIMSEVNKEDN